MDPELAALAGTAGTTLVSLLATDAWHGVSERLPLLWRRARPDREQSVAAELDSSREELLSARAMDDPETEAEVRAEWQGRIRRLLIAHPEVAEDLRALLADVTPDEAARPAPTQQATASGQARIYQASRDLRLDQG